MADDVFRLTIGAAALKAAVARAEALAADKATVPILGYLLLRADRDGLRITGTDTDHQATVSTPADVEVAGAVTVSARTLADVSAKLPQSETVTLAAEFGSGAMRLQCGRSRFKLLTLPPGDFPEFAPDHVGAGFPHRIELAGKVLADVLNRCRFAISTEETRYYLGGAYLHVVEAADGPRLRVVATDGHRLARIDTPHVEAGLDPEMPGVIIGRQIVPELLKLAKEADGETVALEVSRSLVRLTAGATVLTSKLIDGTFPDYARVIPTAFEREARAPTLELIACLERVRVLADAKCKGVRLDLAPDTLTVSLRRPFDDSEAEDVVDIELSGPPAGASFNAKFLAEILAQTGGDTVRIKLGAEGTPAVIADKLGDGLFVLMPLKD